MITDYQDFYYNVADMERAIRFYERALGLKRSHGNEYWASLTLGSLKLGLHWAEGEEIPRTPRDSHGQNCGGTLTLRSDDIPSDRKKIEAAGGKVLGEMDQPWGHMLIFEDLDGNVLKLMNPKSH